MGWGQWQKPEPIEGTTVISQAKNDGVLRGVNSGESGWPKYWSFSNSISSSNEYSELISYRTDWFDLIAVQGTVKTQYHNLKASILSAQPSL